MGAEERDVLLVNAFLHNRKMSVKINDTFSTPKFAPGGAPQGSILACFLFCATIENLLHIDQNNAPVPVLPPPPPDDDEETPIEDISTNSDEENCNEEESIAFFRWFKPRVIEETFDSTTATQEQLDNFLESDWEIQPPEIKGYIDDFNVVEKIQESNAVTHHTTEKTRSTAHAPSSELVFAKLNTGASEINMVVNPSKTQMVCISAATTKESTSYINTPEGKLRSGKELKILGFHFNDTPTINFHIEKMLAKARDRIWSLRHLKKYGMGEQDLLHFYRTFIRPILDYGVPTYHPQLTATLAAKIESLQAAAMRAIYGPLVSYDTVLTHEKIEPHHIRRAKLVEKFTLKASKNINFRRKWFPPNDLVEYGLRTRKTYKEEQSRTQRHYKSPIQHMRRLLNRKETTNRSDA